MVLSYTVLVMANNIYRRGAVFAKWFVVVGDITEDAGRNGGDLLLAKESMDLP